jgi:tRNA(Ile)-lysidine synthase
MPSRILCNAFVSSYSSWHNGPLADVRQSARAKSPVVGDPYQTALDPGPFSRLLPPRYHADGMLDRVAQFIARHRMFDLGTPQAGQRVGVAVSGGADSVFLLHALRELAPRWNLRLTVIHVEHGIRGPASLADAEFVAHLASTLGLPFQIHHADVPAMPGNLEQAARNVRQAFYVDLIASRTVDRVATGHTRTDQAETVLYRILRGSGLTGLSGILPATREGLIRPLLEIDRNEIETWLRERGIAWREDETNCDRTYARNRLRHDILPLLRDGFNPRLDAALGHLSTLARDEEAYWESELARHLPPATSHQPLVLPVSQLTGPSARGRRLIRRAMEIVKVDLHGIDFAHVERVIEMAGSREGHDRMQAPGLDVCRSFDWIRIAQAGPTADEVADFSLPLEIPGSVELPGSGARIVLQVQEKDACTQPCVGVPCAKMVDELDWQRFYRDKGAPSLELRNWRPGDQYRRVGQNKAEKIKFFFQEARVPLWERRDWPIITYAGKIVWARRFGAAAEFATGPQTRSVLQVAETGW